MNETQFLGALVLALASLTGLFAVVGKPIMNAVKIMTELNLNIKALKGDVIDVKTDVKEQALHAKEGRRKLWAAHEDLDRKISGHESRIRALETKVQFHHDDLR